MGKEGFIRTALPSHPMVYGILLVCSNCVLLLTALQATGRKKVLLDV